MRKTYKKKLSLSKETIASLSDQDQSLIKAGYVSASCPDFGCEYTDRNFTVGCPSINFRYCHPSHEPACETINSYCLAGPCDYQ